AGRTRPVVNVSWRAAGLIPAGLGERRRRGQALPIARGFTMRLSRSRAEAVALAAVEIMNDGRYANLLGETIDIADDLRRAVAGTVSYPPGSALPRFAAGGKATTFEGTNETTLAAAGPPARDGPQAGRRDVASAQPH